MKRNPSSKLTLTECYQRFVDTSEFSERYSRQVAVELRRWERLAGSPAVGDVTNETVAKWRAAMIDKGYSPATIRGTWGTIRMVFRRIGPVFNGNPLGLSIIEAVPYCKPVKRPHKLPKRVSLDDLNRTYLAAKHMTLPQRGIAADWWRALLVVLLTTGSRIGDVLKIRMEDIDLDAGTLFIHVGKTGVEAELPLHPVAVEHIARIQGEREFLFGMRDRHHFMGLWHKLMKFAGVKFLPHDVRRTACSEVDAACRGMGKVLLLHAPVNVTERSYLNSLPELRAAIESMEIPLAFKHGLAMSERQRQQQRRQAIDMAQSKFAPPTAPSPEAFTWFPDGFIYQGRFCRIRGKRLRLFQTLVAADGPLSVDQIIEEICGTHRSMQSILQDLRRTIRALLLLPVEMNPIPAVTRSTDGDTTYRLIWPEPTRSVEKGGAA